MKYLILLYGCLLIAPAVCSGASAARDNGIDRDPFFSDGPRAAGKASSTVKGESFGRDPFSRPFEGQAPARRTEAREAGRKLTGIIYSETSRVAIIDGEAVKEGGFSGGQKLVTVKSRSIVLTGGAGGSEELFLEDFTIGK